MKSVIGTTLCVALAIATAGAATASDWAGWRGPQRDGTSTQTGLISSWSLDGENLLWRVDFTGRSTPVVFDGKVCANGRTGEDELRQEMVACFDAESGEELWRRRFNLYHTSVPWSRVGWANLAADPETGYLYVQGVGGLFHCLESDSGETLWSKQLIEEYGFMEGYGGRTQTPFIDEDRVILSFSSTSWGSEARPLHRYRAFDKRTGDLLWTSSPAPSQADKNTQSTPNLAVINGRRLIVAGNGGGGIYAVEARTGEKVWGFQLSKRGLNSSVLVAGSTVYAAHSEENIDEGTLGRVVAIDGTGSGDVTDTHELWRAPLGVGYTSPTLADGRLYVVDNSANLHALDAATGEHLWELSLGRVGKGSPVAADGRLYLTEVNGRFVIVEPGEEEGKILDLEEIAIAGADRMAEIYSSPAIANGRIYFTTEEGLYCLGDADAATAPAPTRAGTAAAVEDPASPDATPARLRLVPGEVILRPGESVSFAARAFDELGRSLGERHAEDTEWALRDLSGEVDDRGRFTPDADAASEVGMVVARVGDVVGSARVRVLRELPLTEDFEGLEVGGRPAYQMAYLARWAVEEQDGNKVLTKGPSPIKIHRHITFLGHPQDSDYTIEADLMGTLTGRRRPDMGLIASGYTLDLLGNHQQLQIRSWQAGLRIAKEVDFPWQPDVWYRMVLRVEESDGAGLVRGKVWPRDDEEPAEWSIVVRDPLPIRQGAAGLTGYSPTPVYYDNILVRKN